MTRGLRSLWMMVLLAGAMGPVPAVRAETPEQAATVVAQAWARAVMTRDVDAQMKLLPSTMYAKPGERERNRLLRLHAKEMAIINKEQTLTFDVRGPMQTLVVNKVTAVVLPYQSVVSTAGGTLQTDSVLIALGEEDGRWSVFDGSGYVTRSLKALIPGYTAGLAVPTAVTKLLKSE